MFLISDRGSCCFVSKQGRIKDDFGQKLKLNARLHPLEICNGDGWAKYLSKFFKFNLLVLLAGRRCAG